MSNNAARMLFTLSAAALLLVCLLLWRPGYFASSSGLSLLIGGEILLAAIASYRKAFFPFLLLCFLLAGTSVPFKMQFVQARWPVLAVGALVGLAIYMKTHSHKFRAIHLVAFFCVLSGLVSALVSAYPGESLLKALSLFLLFLYVCAGARTAVIDSQRFFRGLLRGAEVLVIVATCCYLVLRWGLFGNPNSLGAIMAIIVLPLLLWGFLTAQARPERLRLGAELLCAFLLLFSSFSRASIGAAFVSCFLMCWVAREFRMFAKGTAIALVLAVCAVMFIPRPTDVPGQDENESISSVFLYKGKREAGMFGSRRSVWQKTWNVIREKPWFGSGFGTSEIDQDMTKLEYAQRHIDSWVIREHGNSYLAITEWTGLLGVVPFFALVILVATSAAKTFVALRRMHDISCPALVAAAIAISGLVHATFEDWLFAVGYYVCVFFWSIVFILIDIMPSVVAVYSPEPIRTEPVSAYVPAAAR